MQYSVVAEFGFHSVMVHMRLSTKIRQSEASLFAELNYCVAEGTIRVNFDNKILSLHNHLARALTSVDLILTELRNIRVKNAVCMSNRIFYTCRVLLEPTLP